jgi:hypothetical protein
MDVARAQRTNLQTTHESAAPSDASKQAPTQHITESGMTQRIHHFIRRVQGKTWGTDTNLPLIFQPSSKTMILAFEDMGHRPESAAPFPQASPCRLPVACPRAPPNAWPSRGSRPVARNFSTDKGKAEYTRELKLVMGRCFRVANGVRGMDSST